MIKKLLVANRGEIACRVMRTAKAMGITTVAVYSTADEKSLHVAMADECVCIGPPPARESYLNIENIIDAAIHLNVDAIHPGYGFLSENASFARAVEKAGLIFTGAPVKAMEDMGDKSRSKKIMAAAGVPLVPGFNEPDAAPEELFNAAKSTGFPLLLKASSGGGGKGIRIVSSPSDFYEALESAKREALSAFGNDQIIIERYIEQPRHVEVQIFFDQHGNGVYLSDRDCSLQRRYQKVIEEAPAPGLPEHIHKALGETAVRAGKAVNYVGAGTVEFLLDAKHNFYFMEMNTRLQVEHPVTEMITGIDLVKWQINIANGEHLPVKQEEIQYKGHAMEARLYAENPAHDFTPSSGTIEYLKWPEEKEFIRIEAGVKRHDEVTPWYDPMLAKVVAWGADRQEALNRLSGALQTTFVSGFSTNRDFLISLLNVPDFVKGNMNTATIESTIDTLTQVDPPVVKNALTAASLYTLYQSNAFIRGWRVNAPQYNQLIWEYQNETYLIALEKRGNQWEIHQNRQMFQNIVNFDVMKLEDNVVQITLEEKDHKPGRLILITQYSEVTAIFPSGTVVLKPPEYKLDKVGKENPFVAPMNGIVSSVKISEGERIEKDHTVMTIEAMKMEISIKTPHSGIASVFFKAGDTIQEGDILFECEEIL